MTPSVNRATVVGSGAMGTLCALLLANRGVDTILWGRSPDHTRRLDTERQNKRYLAGHAFPQRLEVTTDVDKALEQPDLIVSAVPCQYIRALWTTISRCGRVRAPVVSVAKGIEVDTLLRPTQILGELIGDVSLAALSGPSLATEIARGLPAAVVVASRDPLLAAMVQHALSTSTFRIYTNNDLIGVELAGAAKNVIAIAAGIADGLDQGNNASASLLTRGLVEITRLGVAIGGVAETFRGLAGIGDLVATCGSPLSRNHVTGEKIGRGVSVDDAVAGSNGVVEGIESTRSIIQLADRHGVEMPITRAIHSVLFGRRSPREVVTELMTRQLKAE